MQTPIPPRIQPSGQFSSMQIDQAMKNDGTVLGNTVSSGYISEKGSITTIDGQSQQYTAPAVAGGLIIRTGLTVSISNDLMPSATDLATELELLTVDGASYTRTLGVYNNTNYAINLNGIGWNFLNSNYIAQYNAYTIMYSISYTDLDGWAVNCLFTGSINLD